MDPSGWSLSESPRLGIPKITETLEGAEQSVGQAARPVAAAPFRYWRQTVWAHIQPIAVTDEVLGLLLFVRRHRASHRPTYVCALCPANETSHQ
jgi:hypothetical protein